MAGWQGDYDGGRRFVVAVAEVAAEFEDVAAVYDGRGFEVDLTGSGEDFEEEGFVTAAVGRGLACNGTF